MMQAGKNKIDELGLGNCDFPYHTVQESDSWRISFDQELVELRALGPDLNKEELQSILEYLCTE